MNVARTAATLCSALLLFGCMSTQPKAVRDQSVVPELVATGAPTLLRDVDVTLPAGWTRVRPALLVNESTHARISIIEGKFRKSAELDLREMCRELTVDGWGCAERGYIAPDGKEGMFAYTKPERRGLVAVRHFPDGHAVLLRGEWPTVQDVRARRDFNAIFSSVTLP